MDNKTSNICPIFSSKQLFVFFLNCTNLINCSMRRYFIISPRVSLMVNLRCPLGFGCDWNGNGSLGIGSLAHHYITAVGQAVRIYILSGVWSVFSLPATNGYLVWGSPCYRIWFGDSPTIGCSLAGPFWRENKDCEEMRPKVGPK